MSVTRIRYVHQHCDEPCSVRLLTSSRRTSTLNGRGQFIALCLTFTKGRLCVVHVFMAWSGWTKCTKRSLLTLDPTSPSSIWVPLERYSRLGMILLLSNANLPRSLTFRPCSQSGIWRMVNVTLACHAHRRSDQFCTQYRAIQAAQKFPEAEITAIDISPLPDRYVHFQSPSGHRTTDMHHQSPVRSRPTSSITP